MAEVELTRDELSVALDGLGTRQIHNLEKEGMPCRADGNRKLYPLEAVAWYWRRKMEEEAEKHRTDEMEKARIRKVRAEAESKELDLAVKRAELVPMDEMEVLLREEQEAVNSVIRHSPSRLAPRLAKAAGIPVREARTIMEDMAELVRQDVREDVA